MKSILSVFILAALLFVGCGDKDTDATGALALNFKATYAGAPLVMFDQTYAYPDGSPMKFQLFNYFVSDITLVKAGQIAEDGHVVSEVERVDYADFFTTDKATAGITYNYDIPEGVYAQLRIGLGISPDLNATQPGNYRAGHPLTDNYWSWALGYVFAKIEATADIDGDGQFTDKLTYHIGADELYTVITLDKPIVITKDTPASATFEVDVQKVLQNNGNYLDITQPQNTQDHSNNVDVYGFLWNNLTAAFRLKD